MDLNVLPLGAFEANCYLLTSGDACVVIDPGGDAERLQAELNRLGVTPALVLLTHGHVDHIGAANALKQTHGTRVLIHLADRDFVEDPHPYFAQLVGGVEACAVDGGLEDGQLLEVGEIALRVLHTPGHSLGSVCFQSGEMLFTGDTLFAGSVGRTDLPGGSWETLEQSLRRLLAEASPDTIVYPGHGAASTMGEEAASNPFLSDLV